MTFPFDYYGDPARALERKQEREEKERERLRRIGCDKCRHVVSLWGVEYCALGLTTAGKNNMRRCTRYKGKEE